MAAKRSCPLKSGHLASDVIFTDYYGLAYLKKKAKGLLQHYKYVFICLSEYCEVFYSCHSAKIVLRLFSN